MDTKLTPYLMFTNTSREALDFYQSIFGGKVEISTFKEFGAGDGLSEEEANRVMHGSLTGGACELMSSDRVSGMPDITVGDSITLALSGSDEETLRKYFDALSAGGVITTPLAKQVWGDLYGDVTDKYGFRWLVNIKTKKPDESVAA